VEEFELTMLEVEAFKQKLAFASSEEELEEDASLSSQAI